MPVDENIDARKKASEDNGAHGYSLVDKYASSSVNSPRLTNKEEQGDNEFLAAQRQRSESAVQEGIENIDASLTHAVPYEEAKKPRENLFVQRNTMMALVEDYMFGGDGSEIDAPEDMKKTAQSIVGQDQAETLKNLMKCVADYTPEEARLDAKRIGQYVRKLYFPQTIKDHTILNALSDCQSDEDLGMKFAHMTWLLYHGRDDVKHELKNCMLTEEELSAKTKSDAAKQKVLLQEKALKHFDEWRQARLLGDEFKTDSPDRALAIMEMFDNERFTSMAIDNVVESLAVKNGKQKGEEILHKAVALALSNPDNGAASRIMLEYRASRRADNMTEDDLNQIQNVAHVFHTITDETNGNVQGACTAFLRFATSFCREFEDFYVQSRKGLEGVYNNWIAAPTDEDDMAERYVKIWRRNGEDHQRAIEEYNKEVDNVFLFHSLSGHVAAENDSAKIHSAEQAAKLAKRGGEIEEEKTSQQLVKAVFEPTFEDGVLKYAHGAGKFSGFLAALGSSTALVGVATGGNPGAVGGFAISSLAMLPSLYQSYMDDYAINSDRTTTLKEMQIAAGIGSCLEAAAYAGGARAITSASSKLLGKVIPTIRPSLRANSKWRTIGQLFTKTDNEVYWAEHGGSLRRYVSLGMAKYIANGTVSIGEGAAMMSATQAIRYLTREACEAQVRDENGEKLESWDQIEDAMVATFYDGAAYSIIPHLITSGGRLYIQHMTPTEQGGGMKWRAAVNANSKERAAHAAFVAYNRAIRERRMGSYNAGLTREAYDFVVSSAHEQEEFRNSREYKRWSKDQRYSAEAMAELRRGMTPEEREKFDDVIAFGDRSRIELAKRAKEHGLLDRNGQRIKVFDEFLKATTDKEIKEVKESQAWKSLSDSQRKLAEEIADVYYEYKRQFDYTKEKLRLLYLRAEIESRIIKNLIETDADKSKAQVEEIKKLQKLLSRTEKRCEEIFKKIHKIDPDRPTYDLRSKFAKEYDIDAIRQQLGSISEQEKYYTPYTRALFRDFKRIFGIDRAAKQEEARQSTTEKSQASEHVKQEEPPTQEKTPTEEPKKEEPKAQEEPQKEAENAPETAEEQPKAQEEEEPEPAKPVEEIPEKAAEQPVEQLSEPPTEEKGVERLSEFQKSMGIGAKIDSPGASEHKKPDKKFTGSIDIKESDIAAEYPEAYRELFIDRATGKNIVWVTSEYEEKGKGFGKDDEINPELLKQDFLKSRATRIEEEKQNGKTASDLNKKKYGEVFTPTCIANLQNNEVSAANLGRDGAFNTITQKTIKPKHGEEYLDFQWKTNREKIQFPKGRTWKWFVGLTQMEITCGEAPYLVSRYENAPRGDEKPRLIPVEDRIGLLDRKLRVVSENTTTEEEFFDAAKLAYMSTYGYELLGSSVLLARENLLFTFYDYYVDKFNKAPSREQMADIATIVSWNIWQMRFNFDKKSKDFGHGATATGEKAKFVDWEGGEVVVYDEYVDEMRKQGSEPEPEKKDEATEQEEETKKEPPPTEQHTDTEKREVPISNASGVVLLDTDPETGRSFEAARFNSNRLEAIIRHHLAVEAKDIDFPFDKFDLWDCFTGATRYYKWSEDAQKGYDKSLLRPVVMTMFLPGAKMRAFENLCDVREEAPKDDFGVFKKALMDDVIDRSALVVIALHEHAKDSRILGALEKAINIFVDNNGMLTLPEALTLSADDLYLQGILPHFCFEKFDKSQPSIKGVSNFLANAYMLDLIAQTGDPTKYFKDNGWSYVPEDIPVIAASPDVEAIRSEDFVELRNGLCDGDTNTVVAWNKAMENRRLNIEDAKKDAEAAERIKERDEHQEEVEKKAKENPPQAAPSATQVKIAAGVKDAQNDFANEVADWLSSKKKLTNADVEKLAKKHKDGLGAEYFDDKGNIDKTTGGRRRLQQLVELGIARAARRIAFADNGKNWEERFAEMIELYNNQPVIANVEGSKTVVTKMLQQYSTPVPIGYLAGLFIYGTSPKRLLEPTAGNGLLVHAIPENAVYANEIDPVRIANLQRQGFADVSNNDALSYNFKKNMIAAYDAVIANPPFGGASRIKVGNFEIGGLDNRIAVNALCAMRDDGRAAIIVGGHTNYTEWDGIDTDRRGLFLNYLYTKYHVKDVIHIDGDIYRRQGAQWDLTLILIDGRKSHEELEEQKRANNGREEIFAPDKSEASIPVKDFESLKERIKPYLTSRQLSEHVSITSDNMPDGMVSEQNLPPEEKPKDIQPSANTPIVADVDIADKDPGVDIRDRVIKDSDGGNKEEKPSEPKPAIEPDEETKPPEPETETPEPDKYYGFDNIKPVDLDDELRDLDEADDIALDRRERAAKEEAAKKEKPEKKPKKEAEKQDLSAQTTKYVKESNMPETGSVVPASHADALKDAFNRLRYETNKDVDEYVKEKLGIESNRQLEERFSAEQVDGLALALHAALDKKQSFIIGDMTGVGKGRQAAGIIAAAVKAGKKAIFLTEKPNLFTDFYRDALDIKAEHLRPFIVNNNESMRVFAKDDSGSFITKNGEIQTRDVYSSLPSKEKPEIYKKGAENNLMPIIPRGKGQGKRYDYIVATYSQFNIDVKETEETYSSLRAKPEEQRTIKDKEDLAKAEKQLTKINWLKAMASDAIVVMDESHNAAGDADTSNTFANMLEVVKKSHGTVFLSATYAKRPDNLPLYLEKTSLKKIGDMDTEAWLDVLRDKAGGIVWQEEFSQALVGNHYIRRERDFAGVRIDYLSVSGGEKDANGNWTYKNDEDKKYAEDAIKAHDECVGIINGMITYQRAYLTPFFEKIYNHRTKDKKTIRATTTEFANVFHTYVSMMMLSLKAPKIADRAIEHFRNGKAPIIFLHNTNEQTIMKIFNGQAGGEPEFSELLKFKFNDIFDGYYVGTASGGKSRLGNLLKFNDFKSFRNRYDWDIDEYIKREEKKHRSREEVLKKLSEMYDNIMTGYKNLMDRINKFKGIKLNAIDTIKQRIRDAGLKVGEITGRTTQQVRHTAKDGKYIYTIEPLKIDRVVEAQNFNAGAVDIILLNDAGATGISLHATPGSNALNGILGDDGKRKPRQRVTLDAQVNLNVDKVIQARGRSDRTGQIYRGEFEYYIFKEIEADNRAFMVLQKKLKSLDANTVSSQSASQQAGVVASNDDEDPDLRGTPDFLNIIGDKVVKDWMHDNVDIMKEANARINARVYVVDKGTKTANPKVVNKLPVYESKKSDLRNLGELQQQGGEEEWTILEDAAAVIARHMMIMPVSVQAKFFKEVVELYKTEYKRLKDKGTNPLVRQVLPLNAHTEKTDIYIPAIDKNAHESYLREDSYLETVLANIIGEPLSRAEIERLKTSYLNTGLVLSEEEREREMKEKIQIQKRTPEEYRDWILSKAEAHSEKIKRSALAAFEENTAKQLAKVKEDYERDSFNRARAEMRKRLEDRFKEKFEEFKQKFRSGAVNLLVGSVVKVPNDLGVEGQEDSNDLDLSSRLSTFGVVVGFKMPSGDSVTPSSVSLVIATLDERGLVQIPLNNKQELDAIFRETMEAIKRNEIASFKFADWDNIKPTEKRRTMRIVTNNLISPLKEESFRKKVRGRIMTYTTDTGEIKRGAAMPSSWKPEANTVLWADDLKTVYDSLKSFRIKRELIDLSETAALVNEHGDLYFELSSKSRGYQTKVKNICDFIKEEGGGLAWEGIQKRAIQKNSGDPLKVLGARTRWKIGRLYHLDTDPKEENISITTKIVIWLSKELNLRMEAKDESNTDDVREQRAFSTERVSGSKEDTERFAKLARMWVNGHAAIEILPDKEFDKERKSVSGRVPEFEDMDDAVIYGFYDVAKKRIVVRENSRADTLLHEAGGHFTWNYFRENDRRRFNRLLKMVKEGAPEVLKEYVRERNPHLAADGREEEFYEEVFATALNDDFRSEHDGTEPENWWAKVKKVFISLWEHLMSIFKKETPSKEVDFDKFLSYGFDEAVRFLAEEYAAGKRVATIETINNAQDRASNWSHSQLKDIGEKQIRFQRAAKSIDDSIQDIVSNATKAIGEEYKDYAATQADRLDALIAELSARRTSSGIKLFHKTKTKRGNLTEAQRRNLTEIEKSHAAREFIKKQDIEKPDLLPSEKKRLHLPKKYPMIGDERISGWSFDLLSYLRDDSEEGDKLLFNNDKALGDALKAVMIPMYRSVRDVVLKDKGKEFSKVDKLITKIINTADPFEAAQRGLDIENIFEAAGVEEYYKEKHKVVENFLNQFRHGVNINARPSQKTIDDPDARSDETYSNLSKYFAHAVYAGMKSAEIGKAAIEESYREAVDKLARGSDLSEQQKGQLELLVLARKMWRNKPLSKMNSPEMDMLMQEITHVIGEGIELHKSNVKARKIRAEEAWGSQANALAYVKNKLKHDGKLGGAEEKTLSNAKRFAYPFVRCLDVLSKDAPEDLLRSARAANKRIAEINSKAWSDENTLLRKDRFNMIRLVLAARGHRMEDIAESPDGNDSRLSQTKQWWAETVWQMMSPAEGSERFSLYDEQLRWDQLIQLRNSLKQDVVKHMFEQITEKDTVEEALRAITKLLGEIGDPKAKSEEAQMLWRQFTMRHELEKFLKDNGWIGVADALIESYRWRAPLLDEVSVRETDGLAISDASRDYSPIVRGNEYQSFMAGAGLAKLRAQLQFRPGSLIERRHVWKFIDEQASCLQVHARTSYDFAHYVAYADSRELIYSLMCGDQFKDFRDAIPRIYGKAFANMLKQFCIDIHNGKMPGEELWIAQLGNKTFTHLNRLSRIASLGFNAWSMIKQCASIVSFPIETGGIAMLDAMTHLPEISDGIRAVMESEQYKARYGEPFFDRVDRVIQMKAQGNKTDPKTLYYAVLAESASMLPTNLGDRVGVVPVAGLYYKMFEAKFISDGLSEKEAKKKAMVKTWEAIDRTQQARDIQNKDALSRSRNAFLKSWIQFRTSPLQFMAAEIFAIEDWWARKNAASFARLMTIMFHNHLVEPSLIMSVNYLHSLVKGKNEDEKWLKLTPLIVGNMDAFPMLGWIEEALVAKLTGEKYGYRNLMNVPSLEKLMTLSSSAVNLAAAPFSENEGEVAKRAKQLMQQAVFLRYIEEATDAVQRTIDN